MRSRCPCQHGGTLRGRASSGPQQARLVVGDNLHRDAFQKRAQPAFLQKSAHKQWSRELGKNLRRDSAAEKNSTGGHRFQGQIPGFRPVNRNPEIQRTLCQGIGAVQRGVGNCSGCVRPASLRGKSWRFLATALLAQKFINIHQTGTREDAFITDVSVSPGKKLQQFHLQVSLRREIRVSPFAGENLVLISVPEYSRLSQASSGCDDRLVPNRLPDAVQRSEIL